MALQLVLFSGVERPLTRELSEINGTHGKKNEEDEEDTRLRSWVGNLRCLRCSIPNVMWQSLHGQSLA